jgi:PAS domain S-box-containing protein
MIGSNSEKVKTSEGKIILPGDDMQKRIELFENLPVAIYACDSSGYITSYNKAAVKLWGKAPELGKDRWCGSWKIFNADGEPLPLDECPMARTIRTGVAIEGEEIIIQRPDGSLVNILPYPVPVFNEDRKITGAINTLIDITDQKESETKQARLAAIIESSDDAIISKTLDGIVTSWNNAAERMFGHTEEDMVGKSITVLIPPTHLAEETLILSKIRNNEKVEHYETIRLAKDGTQLDVSLTISPIKNNDGHIIGASKIARNISKQRASEEKLQRYAENLEVMNMMGKMVSESLDIEEILQQVTDTTTLLTGAGFGAFFYNKQDEKGESYTLFALSGAPRAAFEKFGMPRNTAVFHPTFSGEGIVRVDDITKDERYGKNDPHHGMPKGHLPVVSYLAVPVISKSGTVIGGLFYGHPEPGKFTKDHENIVAGVATQAAIALDNAMLYEEIKKLNAKKDEFIGLASHELKTPMTSLSGYLQIMDRGIADDDRNKGFIKKALSQINKLSTLISDLLDVSKIETGTLPLSYAPFDFRQLAEEVIDIVQYSTKSHTIILDSDVKELIVWADRQRVEQVIINLLSNAVKYSPKANTVEVSISKKGDKAMLAVRDFGMGIDKEHQERIFSRFYRVEELSTNISGLGIGLYISHEIIARHKGELWVDSELGKGSVFVFEIPVAQ